MARDVIIFDTTLRDRRAGARQFDDGRGEAASRPPAGHAWGGRDRSGVPERVGTADRRGVRAIAEAVRRPVIAALARCHDRDIDFAGEAVRPAARPRVHVFIATSDLHLQCKLRLSREPVSRAGTRRGAAGSPLHGRRGVLSRRRDPHGSGIPVPGGRGGHRRGGDHDQSPDTVGYALPVEYAAMFRAVRERVPNAEPGSC